MEIGYLTFTDISKKVSSIHVSESLHGTLDTDLKVTPPFYSLNDAAQMLIVNEKPCLFTMGNTAPGYTCAIVKNEGQY